jgi:hypothetical protein
MVTSAGFAKAMVLGFLGLASVSASASDSSFIDVKCLSGGANSSTSFRGWVYGTAEPVGEGFVVKGSKIEVSARKIDDPGCRLVYEDIVNVWGDEWETKIFSRTWNALAVKTSNSSTYMTCALGSVFTSTPDSDIPFNEVTFNKIDSVHDRIKSRDKVSSSKCLINELTQ